VSEYRPLRVLVIEDDDDLRHLLGLLLQRLGHDVIPAACGESALSLAGQRPPDVAFVDYELPGIDGRQVVQRLRADGRTAATRIVAATPVAPDVHGMDPHAVLPQPFVPQDVAAVLDSLDLPVLVT
jgi:CheY-like chemotaxis protein